MLKSVWEDLVLSFKTGNMILRLILVNIVVFVIINLIGAMLNIANGLSFNETIRPILKFVGLSADFKYFITHPWGIITSMFLHIEPGHIFWNMVLLYFFGRILTDLLGQKRVLPIYIMGGLMGGLFYILSSFFIPTTFAIGASGAVTAFIVASGFLAPDYKVHMIFFTTTLKYVVVAILFLDFIGLSAINSTNVAHSAHLGGAFFGWLFVYLYRNKGLDLSESFNDMTGRIMDIFQRSPKPKRPQPKVAFKNKEKINQKRQQPGRRSDYGTVQERIDDILDKINKNGIKSLSPEEKAFLNDYNKL